MNFPANRTDFKVFRNVQNDIKIYVHDVDRHAVSLLGKSLTFNLVDEAAGTVIVTRDLLVVDDIGGQCLATVYPGDLTGIEDGFYSYTVTVTRADGSQEMLYTDLGYGTHGVVEVRPGPVPNPVSSQVIVDFNVHSWGTPLQAYNVTNTIVGPAQVGHTSGVQTFAVYLTNFTGQLWMEASLENQAPSRDADWFNVPLTDTTSFYSFTGANGIHTFTVEGNFMFVRFYYQSTSGTLTQILYRN